MADQGGSKPGPFGRDMFSDIMRRPGMAPAMFLPVERSQWINGRYTLGKNPAPLPAGEFTGVRLQVPDPRNLNKTNEHNVQGDLSQLIGSLTALRSAHPELAATVLSNESVVVKDRSGTKRVRFGLACDPAGGFRDEAAAAAECHKQILRGIRKGWFAIESQPEFDAARGFAGLSDWAKGVRLKKSWDWRWLLLLLLLLPFLMGPCRPTDPMAGKTKSFIIVLDKSSSMQPHFTKVQEEARNTLESIANSALQRFLGFFGQTYYVDVIAYNDTAESCFDGKRYAGKNGLQPVTPETKDEVLRYIGGLMAGQGTNLKSAITLAEQKIKVHEKETTLCIISDGIDGSIGQMTQEMKNSPNEVRGRFGMSPGGPALVHANTLSPRLLKETNRTAVVVPGDPTVKMDDDPWKDKQLRQGEIDMAAFSQAFFGVFGFTGAAFGQRGMPTSHKVWNTLLWLTRMAIIAGVIAYAYPRLRARF